MSVWHKCLCLECLPLAIEWKLLNNNSLSNMEVLEMLISFIANDSTAMRKNNRTNIINTVLIVFLFSPLIRNEIVGQAFKWYGNKWCLISWCFFGMETSRKRQPFGALNSIEMQRSKIIKSQMQPGRGIERTLNKWMPFINGSWLYTSHISPLNELHISNSVFRCFVLFSLLFFIDFVVREIRLQFCFNFMVTQKKDEQAIKCVCTVHHCMSAMSCRPFDNSVAVVCRGDWFCCSGFFLCIFFYLLVCWLEFGFPLGIGTIVICLFGCYYCWEHPFCVSHRWRQHKTRQ